MERIAFTRGDTAAVLIHHQCDDSVLLVKQFRFSQAAAWRADEATDAWPIELVSGWIEPGQTAVETATAESAEEAGYDVSGKLEHVIAFCPSPAVTADRVHVFIARVDSPSLDESVAPDPEEDIESVRLPFREALAMTRDGRIRDAAAVIALQWMALERRDDQTRSRPEGRVSASTSIPTKEDAS